MTSFLRSFLNCDSHLFNVVWITSQIQFRSTLIRRFSLLDLIPLRLLWINRRCLLIFRRRLIRMSLFNILEIGCSMSGNCKSRFNRSGSWIIWIVAARYDSSSLPTFLIRILYRRIIPSNYISYLLWLVSLAGLSTSFFLLFQFPLLLCLIDIVAFFRRIDINWWLNWNALNYSILAFIRCQLMLFFGTILRSNLLLMSNIHSFKLPCLFLMLALSTLLIGSVIIIFFRTISIVFNDVSRLLLQPIFLVLSFFLSLLGAHWNKFVLLICATIIVAIVERVFNDIRVTFNEILIKLL